MSELDGRPVTTDQLQTLALTNYGHFTSMRVEDGRVRGLLLHLERLERDCRTLFDAELDTDRVRELVRNALQGTADAVVVRVTVYDPGLDLGRPAAATEPKVLVTTRPAASLPQPSMRVKSAVYERELPAVKHVGLMGLIHHRRRAQLAGFHDTLFTDEDSFVSEGGTWNVGFVDDDTLVWPRADVLTGVTMQLLNQAHDGPIDTRPLRIPHLASMRAVFATNAAIGVRGISAVDDIELPDQEPLLETLRKEYARLASEEL